MSSLSRSRTVMLCRLARRATTYRPIRRVTATSRSGGSASRALAAPISSSDIPTPWSVIWMASSFLRVIAIRTMTFFSGSEKKVALSRSSAMTCTRSETARPWTATSGAEATSTRA